MRTFATLCCAAACAGVAFGQSAEDRLEFSGLESPCDEAAGDQEDTLAAIDVTNDDIADQLDALQQRVENELLTYGDTTNICASSFCAIGGGQNNKIDEDSVFSLIRGGKGNWCYLDSPYSVISGGQSNVATGDYCAVGGGIKNKCYSNYAAIGGGYLNMANGRFATIVGGSKNSAKGRYSLAGGFKATVAADYAAAFNLGLDECTNELDNSVKVCGDSFVLNGVDYTEQLSAVRQLKEDDVDCKHPEPASEEQRIQAFESVVATLLKLSSQ